MVDYFASVVIYSTVKLEVRGHISLPEAALVEQALGQIYCVR